MNHGKNHRLKKSLLAKQVHAFLIFVLASALGGLSVKNTGVPSERRPASESDDGFAETYANDSVADLEREYQRQNGAKRRHRNVAGARKNKQILIESIGTDQDAVSAARNRREAEDRTGIKVRRARLVNLHTDVFQEQSHYREMELRLFDDAIFALILQEPSVYGVNHAIYVGQVAEDLESRVRITIDGANMNGTIETRRASYRIVSAGAGLHYIIETEPSLKAH